MDFKETGKLLEDIGRFAELMGICRTVFENRTGAKSAGSSQSPTPAITSRLVSPLSLSHFSAQNAKQWERGPHCQAWSHVFLLVILLRGQ